MVAHGRSALRASNCPCTVRSAGLIRSRSFFKTSTVFRNASICSLTIAACARSAHIRTRKLLPGFRTCKPLTQSALALRNAMFDTGAFAQRLPQPVLFRRPLLQQLRDASHQHASVSCHRTLLPRWAHVAVVELLDWMPVPAITRRIAGASERPPSSLVLCR